LGHLNLLAVAAADNTTQPMAVTVFDADIVLYTRIARADGLTLTDEVLVDGHATLEMKYL
jgi:class 3 adenylate cyclase